MEKSFRTYKMSDHCQRLFNPILNFVENDIALISPVELYDSLRPKEPINVSIGDPTFYKDFKPNSKDLELLSK